MKKVIVSIGVLLAAGSALADSCTSVAEQYLLASRGISDFRFNHKDELSASRYDDLGKIADRLLNKGEDSLALGVSQPDSCEFEMEEPLSELLTIPWTRNIGCIPEGREGAAGAGTYTLYRTWDLNGVEGATRSELKMDNLVIIRDGRMTSVANNLSASTLINGDGDDQWFSSYVSTSSPKIKSIQLHLYPESVEKNDSVITTPDGRAYKASCTINGASG
jgi:hypothetical protein